MDELQFDDLKQLVDFYKTRAHAAEDKVALLQLLAHRLRLEIANFDGKTQDLKNHITSLENKISSSKVVPKTKTKKDS